MGAARLCRQARRRALRNRARLCCRVQQSVWPESARRSRCTVEAARTLSSRPVPRHHRRDGRDAQHQASAARLKCCAATAASARWATSRPSTSRIRKCMSTRSKRKPNTSSATPVRRAWPIRPLSARGPRQHLALFFQSRQITPGSIVVFDFAADLDHMTMDITRTFNIDGKFTPEQAKWYNVDLESQKATIAMLQARQYLRAGGRCRQEGFRREGVGAQWIGYPGSFRRTCYSRRDAAQGADSGRTSRHG